MKSCPYCAEEIPDESRVCKFCNSTVVKKCPFCAEEIHVMAKKCRFCNSEFSSAAGEARPKPAAAPPPSDAPLGEERGIVLTLVLILLTCGIWGLVVQYKIGDELNRHQGRNQINAGLDLLLVFVTCGIWAIYLMYKYPKALQEITVEERMHEVDLTVPCLVLSILGLHLIALLILQHEVNKHWEAHRALPSAGR